MSLLSDSDLTWMRDTLELTMPGTCYILSGTNTSDGQGGFSTSWGTVGTSICRLDIKGGKEMQAGGGYIPFTQVILTLPYDTVITTKNQVKFDDDTYNVVTVYDDRSWHATTRCMLERV
jgi:head-tail adaptor